MAREYADFRLGVRVFPDTRVTAGSAARLDACAVSVYPSLNPDHESLGLPGDALRRFRSITARVDRDGVVLSGADTPYNYQQLIRLIMYTNRKPAYYLDRVFKLTCSELSGRFASNEYVQTLAVIHPKEKLPFSPTPPPTNHRLQEFWNQRLATCNCLLITRICPRNTQRLRFAKEIEASEARPAVMQSRLLRSPASVSWF